jgi:Protein of unknwon function (DUF3310)
MRVANPIRLEDYETENDPINPDHYKQGDLECIDAIQSALSPEEYRGYLKGQIIKYVWREKHKNGQEDVEKAAWYVEKLMETE